MKKYLFTTRAFMTPKYQKKYWIDRDYIGAEYITAETLKDAIHKYVETVNNDSCAEISKTAEKRPNPIYIDGETGEAIQTGLCFIAKTHISDRNAGISWAPAYIELWTDIKEVTRPAFN